MSISHFMGANTRPYSRSFPGNTQKWDQRKARVPHLHGHEGQRVHAVDVAGDAADDGQPAAGQQHRHEQGQHPAVAAHRGGGRKGELKRTNREGAHSSSQR